MKQAVITALASAAIASTSTALIMAQLKEEEQNQIKERLNIQETSIKALEQQITNSQHQIDSVRNEMKEKLDLQNKSITGLENKNLLLEQQVKNLLEQGASIKQMGTMVGNAASWFHSNYKVDVDGDKGVRIHEKDNTCMIL